MKKIIITLLAVLVFATGVQQANALTLDDVLREIKSLRQELSILKSTINQQKSSTSKSVKKKVVKSSSGAKSLPGYDVYATAFNHYVSKMELWALDSAEQLVKVGTMNNTCPFYSGQTLAMDSAGSLYFTRATNSGTGTLTIYNLTCSNNVCTCDSPQTNNVPGLAVHWGAAVFNVWGVDTMIEGINAGNSSSTNTGSSIGQSALGSGSWSVDPLFGPNGAQMSALSGDLAQVAPEKFVTNVGGSNTTNSLIAMGTPGLGSPTNIGSMGVKLVTGLAYKWVVDQPVVYSFTNMIGGKSQVWKHVLNNDRTAIISSTQIGVTPNGVSFHDAASAPVPSESPIADYGDAPDTATGTGPGNYETLRTDNGPKFKPGTVYLGDCVDHELGDLQNGNADADDVNGGTPTFGNCPGPDDETGITFMSQILPGALVKTRISSATGGYVTGWIDFNIDGDFDDTGERVHNGLNVSIGDTVLGTPIPASSSTGTTYARFVISDSPLPASPRGIGGAGEVEDYRINISDDE